MAIPHLVIAIAIIVGVASFIAFAFRQGQQVKSDADTKQHWLQGQGDGGLGSS
jgi:hypothetical protein